MEQHCGVCPAYESTEDFLFKMTWECLPFTENVNSESCPSDCWCQRLPLHLFPEIIKCVKEFSMKENKKMKQNPSGVIKERKKRAKMPDHIRKAKKLQAVRTHREKIAKSIAESQKQLDTLAKENKKLSEEMCFIQKSLDAVISMKHLLDERMVHFHTN